METQCRKKPLEKSKSTITIKVHGLQKKNKKRDKINARTNLPNHLVSKCLWCQSPNPSSTLLRSNKNTTTCTTNSTARSPPHLHQSPATREPKDPILKTQCQRPEEHVDGRKRRPGRRCWQLKMNLVAARRSWLAAEFNAR
ncbi:hypothetical protein Drorol1_Dr00011970 [Drosera rotundifolia]